MANKEFKTRVKHKRDTDEDWTINNPVLLDGEIIIVDTDTGVTRTKIGDGVQTYTQLPFHDNAGGGGRTFVLDITFASLLSGQPFTINGGDFSYSGTVPAGLVAQVDVPEHNTAYTITCGIYYNIAMTTNVFGYYPVGVGVFAPIFADNSWQDISIASLLGIIPPTWNIGDEKSIMLNTGEILALQIYGLGHDDLTSGGKAGITLGTKHLMTSPREINASGSNTGSFTTGDLYKWLTNTILPAFPQDLRAIVKPVDKNTSAGSTSTFIKTESMSIFCFSEVECAGVANSSVAGEGAQYPIFTNNESRRKFLANGVGVNSQWWLRSPFRNNASSFCAVVALGGITQSVSYSTHGVCFGFCI